MQDQVLEKIKALTQIMKTKNYNTVMKPKPSKLIYQTVYLHNKYIAGGDLFQVLFADTVQIQHIRKSFCLGSTLCLKNLQNHSSEVGRQLQHNGREKANPSSKENMTPYFKISWSKVNTLWSLIIQKLLFKTFRNINPFREAEFKQTRKRYSQLRSEREKNKEY